MPASRLTVVTAALAMLPVPTASAENNPWALVTVPSPGPSAAIGAYSGGCLQGAATLPLRGKGFRVMHPERNRRFGHHVLIQFVTELARATAAAGAGPLAIGDLSMARGGPAPTGHASHQSGLDVDIAYGAATSRAPTASLVDAAHNVVNRRWNRQTLALLRRAANDPRVARIFVHPVIKQAACAATEKWPSEQRAWLRQLRPWWGHDDHFHVRLQCPLEDRNCVAQEALTGGDGCADLAWWMDPSRIVERAKQRADYQGRVDSLPALPEACAALLAPSSLADTKNP